jgi:vesicle-associated membrane protein 7
MNGYLSQSQCPSLGIIYSVVARGSIILAQYAAHHGNFTEVSQQVLELVPTDINSKLTYATRDYMYHYICEEGVVYMCITDDEFERSRAFLFLQHIQIKCKRRFGQTLHTAKPYGLNSALSKDLATEMGSYSESILSHVGFRGSVQLDGIAIRDLIDISGYTDLEPLELLESDNESLKSFESSSVLLREAGTCCQCWRRWRRKVIILLIVLSIMAAVAVGLSLGLCADADKTNCPI